MIHEGKRIGIGVPVFTWMDDGSIRQFKSRRRRAPIDEVVVHESVTTTAAKTVSVLESKGYGVHFMIDFDGRISQHVDTVNACAHAGGKHNDRSIGVEIVNPYYARRALPGQAVIAAPWAHKGEYSLPTEHQVKALRDLLRGLVEAGLVPGVFVGLRPGKHTDHETGLAMGKLKDRTPGPGIWAHTYFDHADGAYPLKEAFKLWKT